MQIYFLMLFFSGIKVAIFGRNQSFESLRVIHSRMNYSYHPEAIWDVDKVTHYHRITYTELGERSWEN